MNIFEEVNSLNKRSDKANQAAFASLSTLRIVSKVLGGVLHHSEGLSQDDLEKHAQAMLARVGEQTTDLYQKLDMPAENFALASIAGSVAEVISEHYRRIGPKALEMDWADTLSAAAKMPGIWKEHHIDNSGSSLEMRRSMAMMSAMAPFISAYQRFNYFHSNQEAVVTKVAELLWHTTEESIQSSAVASDMSEPEREMLRTNLVKRAGELYADSWDSVAVQTMAAYKESPAEQRRTWMTEGYPLNEVDDRFLGQYKMLEQAMDVSLRVHFDNDSNTSISPDMG
jgi:hypothetical protein